MIIIYVCATANSFNFQLFNHILSKSMYIAFIRDALFLLTPWRFASKLYVCVRNAPTLTYHRTILPQSRNVCDAKYFLTTKYFSWVIIFSCSFFGAPYSLYSQIVTQNCIFQSVHQHKKKPTRILYSDIFENLAKIRLLFPCKSREHKNKTLVTTWHRLFLPFSKMVFPILTI